MLLLAFLVFVVLVFLLLLMLWWMMSNRKMENMSSLFHCGSDRWDQYILHLQNQSPEEWKKIAEYVLNRPPQGLLTQLCSQLNGGIPFDDIDQSLPQATAIADSIVPYSERGGNVVVATDQTNMDQAQRIQDYIQLTNIQGCDTLKFENYLKQHPDENKQIQSLYDNWINFAFDEYQQKNFKSSLNTKLQTICKTSNPDGRTSDTLGIYNSYEGWLVNQPAELNSNVNLSWSCNSSVLGPIVNKSPQKTLILKFLDEMSKSSSSSSSNMDNLAKVMSWMCSIAQTKPTDFEKAIQALIQQDPSKMNLDAITQTLSPDVQAANAFKIEENNIKEGTSIPNVQVKELTPSELQQALANPKDFDTWVGLNPQSQALFSYYMPCQDTVGQYMNRTKNSKEIYKGLNTLNSSEQVSFFKKLCDSSNSKFIESTTVQENDNMLQDYKNKYTTYWDKSKLQNEISKYLKNHNKIEFIDKVYTNQLSKTNNNVEQTDQYVKNDIIATKTDSSVPKTPQPIQQPVNIKHTPGTSGNIKKYVFKGYLKPSNKLENQSFTNAILTLNPASKEITGRMYPYAFYDAPMSKPENGFNDPTLQNAFNSFFIYSTSVPENVKESSYQGHPYYVLFVVDKKNVCTSIFAMGITDYSKFLSTKDLISDRRVETNGTFQSLWILEDVENAMKATK